MYLRNSTSILFILVCLLLFLSNTFAQIQIIRTFPQTGGLDVYVGSRNMDNDSNEELVYCSPDNYGVIIIDGNTGTVEWDSENFFQLVHIAGYNSYAGSSYGNNPFCDINSDGIFEITFLARPPEVGAWNYYVVGLTGSSGVQGTYVIPKNPSLSQNYPNPFNPTTTIEYEIQNSGNVEIKIYDELGQVIRTLVNEEKELGTYSVLWDGKNDNGSQVSTGAYFYQLKVNDFVSTKKMILMK